jgi:hypothetical protein
MMRVAGEIVTVKAQTKKIPKMGKNSFKMRNTVPGVLRLSRQATETALLWTPKLENRGTDPLAQGI